MNKCVKCEKNIVNSTLNQVKLTLNQAKLKKSYLIAGINKNYDIKYLKRISELGFIAGEKIMVLRKSFLKKTLMIKIKGYAILLDSEIAGLIKIQEEL